MLIGAFAWDIALISRLWVVIPEKYVEIYEVICVLGLVFYLWNSDVLEGFGWSADGGMVLWSLWKRKGI